MSAESGEEGEGRSRAFGRFALGALAVALGIGGALAWWWLRDTSREVSFVELRLVVAFEPLGSGAAPLPPRLGNGYLYLGEESLLVSATGSPVARGPLVVGLALLRPDAHPPAQLVRTLVVPGGAELRWEGPGPELRRGSDPFAALARPAPIALRIDAEGEGCEATVGGESRPIAPGSRWRTKQEVRELSLEDAVAELRAAWPSLPEPDPHDRDEIQLRLDPDADGRVEVLTSYEVACHGVVRLLPDDLLHALREVRRALEEGGLAQAAEGLEWLERLAPRDPAVRALRARLDAESGGAEREASWLEGRVARPPGLPPDAIVEVTVWPAGGGPEAARVQMPTSGERFRVRLPPGVYGVECFLEGREPVRVQARVPQEGEVRCALR